jgi:hypothetical protein
MHTKFAETPIGHAESAIAYDAVSEATAHTLAFHADPSGQVGMTGPAPGLASQSSRTLEEENTVIISGLVDHVESGLLLEDESHRRSLGSAAQAVEIPWNSKFSPCRVCIAVLFLTVFPAPISTQTGRSRDQHSLCIISSGILFTTVQVVKGQWQERNDSRLLVCSVHKAVLESVRSFLH